MADYSLADLLICASAEAWRDNGEVMAFGAGPIPRLAVALAKSSFNPALMTTDGECHYVGDPVPPGLRAEPRNIEGWSPYARTFDTLWGGKRHAMVSPVQLDRFGQSNISVIGDHARPKVALIGARGFPGNTAHHPNSFFLASHSSRALVTGEVDYVCSVGYNPARWLGGRKPIGLDLRLIVTDLAVLDFGGPEHAIRVRSLHPGVSFEQVQDNTGFPLQRPALIPVTPAPTPEQQTLIARLDPHNVRKTVLKGDPPGDRRASSQK
jgi:glutaconate CoA-transferase subunit B